MRPLGHAGVNGRYERCQKGAKPNNLETECEFCMHGKTPARDRCTMRVEISAPSLESGVGTRESVMGGRRRTLVTHRSTSAEPTAAAVWFGRIVVPNLLVNLV